MIEIEDLKNGTFAIVENGDNLAFTDADSAERIKRALERESMTVVAFEATPDQDATIEDVLDLADIRFEATGGTRTDTLVAVLTDWRKRVKAEYEAKKSEDGDTRTQMHLRLDDDDLRDIGAAVERRKAWDCEPDSDSCELGGMIAEICRGWLERVERDKTESERIRAEAAEALAKHDAKQARTDNGDGTVTCHGIDVTVRADVLGGRDVVAVRPPRVDELFVEPACTSITRSNRNWDAAYRIILGPKPQPPAPTQVFRESGFYLTRGGILAGPLEHNSNTKTANTYPWQCNVRGQRRTYTTTGTVLEEAACDDDLLPGEVIVWRHPGLKAGEYTWDGRLIKCGGMIVLNQLTSHHISAWTDPPRAGTWKVIQGQEYATWEGE